MTKEEAVEKIAELFYGTDNVILTEAKKEKLTAILTELMEPIGEQEIIEESNQHIVSGGFNNTRLYREGIIWGAKWAATRNLKVSLEGLKRYDQYWPHPLSTNMVVKDDGNWVKFEDVEKLVG